MTGERSVIRLRMSAHDAHYGGHLVDGARMLGLFGDVATELCILRDGDEGLFRAYDKVEFLAPVHAGDFIEAEGEIVSEGTTSRKMRFVARKVIESVPGHPSHCNVLNPPVTVTVASGTCVVPRDVGRGPQKAPQHVDAILFCQDVVAAQKQLVDELHAVPRADGVLQVGRTRLLLQARASQAPGHGAVEVCCHVDGEAAERTFTTRDGHTLRVQPVSASLR
jgi:3-aminobutyryl-CoA ammonia-lyase